MRLRADLRRRFALAAAALLVMALGIGWALQGLRARTAARSAVPQTEGTLPVSGIAAPVRILRDARGLPHVIAREAADGLFGLGFVHAQDRLGQMLWLRRQAQGRSAESLGRAGVEADRMARLIGFARLAEAQLPHLASDVRASLEAYAAGVNARIARVRSGEVAAPLLVASARLDLEPWQPADSLAVLKLYAWGLGASVDASLVLSDLIQRLGADGARRFFPGEGLGAALPAPGATAILAPVESELPPVAADRATSDPFTALRRQLGLRAASLGSSAWIVGARHSASGRPMLAADHHHPATAPAWFHLDHVQAEGLEVIGATLPGLPVFWSGHNGHVAWASVHAGAVVTDLYIETLDPEDPTRFHDGSRWRPLERRTESLRVRGGPDEELHVRSTAHGPLLPESDTREPTSVAWTGARTDGGSGIGSLLRVARARNAAELRKALAKHREPVIAVVFADAAGEGGMQVAGWIPRRSLSAQLLPLPGRARWYAWNERVPFEDLPAARLDADSDWIVVADGAWPASESSEPVDWLWRPGARAERIEALLKARSAAGALDLRALSNLQADVGSTRHRRIVDAIETLAQQDPTALGPQAQEFLEILRGWDGVASADSRGAAAYHVLLRPLASALIGAPIGTDLWERYAALPQIDLESLLGDVLREAARDVLAGDARAEAVRRVVRESLREAWLQLSFRLGSNVQHWTWGALHPLRFAPFSGLERRGAPAGPGPFPYGGSMHTVQAAAYDPADPFETRVASTLRLALDTDTLDQGLASVAPGQSEHPGHPHFADQVASWREGRASLLPTGTLLVEETAVSQLVLEPVR